MDTDARTTAPAMRPMTIPATPRELRPEADTHWRSGGPHSDGSLPRKESAVKREPAKAGGSWPEKLL
jgi:hypothetical protein